MLDRVQRPVFEIDPRVGGAHAQVVGDHVPVDAGDVEALFQFGVVDAEAGNPVHIQSSR